MTSNTAPLARMNASRPPWLTGLAPLSDDDRAAVAAHLSRLPPADRVQRFGAPTSDAVLAAYVRTMSLRGSVGLFIDGTLAGVAHLPAISERERELGLSVEAPLRAHGWGRALLDASLAALHAAGADTLTAHYAFDNRPMARLVRPLERQTEREGAHCTARLSVEAWARDAASASIALIESVQ